MCSIKKFAMSGWAEALSRSRSREAFGDNSVHTTSEPTPPHPEPEAASLSVDAELRDEAPAPDEPVHPKPRLTAGPAVAVPTAETVQADSAQTEAAHADSHHESALLDTKLKGFAESTTVVEKSAEPSIVAPPAAGSVTPPAAEIAAPPVAGRPAVRPLVAHRLLAERPAPKLHPRVAERLFEPKLVDPAQAAQPLKAELVAEPVLETPVAMPVVGEQWRSAGPVDENGLPIPEPPLSLLGHALWHARNSMSAGVVSALVHFGLMIWLGSIAYQTAKQVEKQPELQATLPPPKFIELPKVETVEIKMIAQTPSAVASKGSGAGSAGASGGHGGGNVGGFNVAPLKVAAADLVASGGSGFGTDKAFGESMMGEVGELKESEATFFGVKASGRNFVFVVDTSGSMSINDRYLRCRAELLRSIGALKYGQKYFVIFFNSQTFAMPENKLVDARPAQITKTQEWCKLAVPSSGTEPWDGLARALRMKPDAIYLLTDGDFDPMVVQRVANAQPQTKKIPIHTICFESLQGSINLETIAKLTNGTYMFVP